MKKSKIPREKIELTEEFEDQTGYGPWEYKGEVYFKVDEIQRHGDGELTDVIVRRQSDNKYFKFTWQYYHDNYYFDEEMEEVFPKTITITKYE